MGGSLRSAKDLSWLRELDGDGDARRGCGENGMKLRQGKEMRGTTLEQGRAKGKLRQASGKLL